MMSSVGSLTIPPWGLVINLAFTVSLLLFNRLTEYSSTLLVSELIADIKICDVNPFGL